MPSLHLPFDIDILTGCSVGRRWFFETARTTWIGKMGCVSVKRTQSHVIEACRTREIVHTYHYRFPTLCT